VSVTAALALASSVCEIERHDWRCLSCVAGTDFNEYTYLAMDVRTACCDAGPSDPNCQSGTPVHCDAECEPVLRELALACAGFMQPNPRASRPLAHSNATWQFSIILQIVYSNT
jgi:hypothetical protein